MIDVALLVYAAAWLGVVLALVRRLRQNLQHGRAIARLIRTA